MVVIILGSKGFDKHLCKINGTPLGRVNIVDQLRWRETIPLRSGTTASLYSRRLAESSNYISSYSFEFTHPSTSSLLGLELRMEARGYYFEWNDILHDLESIEEVIARISDKTLLFRSQMAGCSAKVFQAAGLAVAPTMRFVDKYHENLPHVAPLTSF